MNIFYDVINVISIILEILITVDYFKTVSKKKDIQPLKAFTVCCVLTIVNTVALVLINIQVVTTIIMIASIFILYKLSMLKHIIFSTILVVLLILSEMLIGLTNQVELMMQFSRIYT